MSPFRVCGICLWPRRGVWGVDIPDCRESPQPKWRLVTASLPLGHIVTLDFDYDGGGPGKGGVATLSVDGSAVGATRLKRSIPLRISLDETLDCGEDTGTPVSEDYQVPFSFNGNIIKAIIELKESSKKGKEA